MTVFEHSMDPQQYVAGRQDTLAASGVDLQHRRWGRGAHGGSAKGDMTAYPRSFQGARAGKALASPGVLSRLQHSTPSITKTLGPLVKQAESSPAENNGMAKMQKHTQELEDSCSI